MTTETAIVSELPAMPPPSFEPIFLAVTYYVGPGGRKSTRWKVHHREFKSEFEAEKFLRQLDRWNIHPRIVRIG